MSMSKKIFTADDGRKYQKGSEWIKIHFGIVKNKKLRNIINL